MVDWENLGAFFRHVLETLALQTSRQIQDSMPSRVHFIHHFESASTCARHFLFGMEMDFRKLILADLLWARRSKCLFSLRMSRLLQFLSLVFRLQSNPMVDGIGTFHSAFFPRQDLRLQMQESIYSNLSCGQPIHPFLRANHSGS